MKFALQKLHSHDHETQTVVYYCVMNRIEYRIFNKGSEVPKDYIPVGSVKFVEEVLDYVEVPDYYPDFLNKYLHRKVWRADKWPQHNKVFIKPSDRHKRFTGFITSSTWKGKKKGPYWCSERVNFETEWRYYVAAGQVIDQRYGSGIEEPAPALDIDWPLDYYGACDFGRLDNGLIALVESNSPYACGWYGPISEAENYVKWVAASYVYMQEKVALIKLRESIKDIPM